MMKTYEGYVPTGIRWNAEMPSHWDCDKAKRYFDNPKVINKDGKETKVLSLTLRGVIRNDVDHPIGLAPADYATYQLFDKDELVFKLIDLENISTSRVGIVWERGIMSSAYIRLRPRTKLNLRYFYYQYFDWYKRNIFNGLGAGVRQTLSAADLVNYQVVFPPIDEQDQIVRFLDWKTAEMNRVIHAKNQEIRRLKELRVIAINTAVTKGIKGSTLKKSGSSWLNEIPEDWDMLPSKRLFFLRKEKAKPEDEQLTASQKYGVVPQKWFMEQEGRRVTVVFTGEDILKHVEKGDFVISMRSFQGGIEYSDYSGKISSAYVMLIPNHEYVYDRFFKWFLKSPEYIKALRGTSDLVRDGQALRYANFAKIDLPVVPMDEQIAIADYLDNICKRIDDAIENVKKEISLIHELKTRTIFDVVTGKVDVSGVSIPTYEDMADEILDEDSEDAENEDEEVDE